LLDSAAPTIRFLTMVVLFAAAATWVQMVTRHAPPSTDSMELPKTAAEEPIAPTKNASDHQITAPTAAGPLESNPQSGARVGRAKNDDLATPKQSSTVPCPIVNPSVSPPRFLIAGRESLPQVQTSELPVVGNQMVEAAGAQDAK